MVAGSACVMAVNVGFGMGFVEVKRGCGNLKSCLLPTPPHNHEIQKSLPNLFALYPLIRVSCKMKDVVIFSPMEVTHRHSQSNQPRVCG